MCKIARILAVGFIIQKSEVRVHDIDVISVAAAQLSKQATAVGGVARQLDESFEAAVGLIRAAPGKVVTTGAGTSGIVADRLAHLLSVCGTPSFFLPAMDGLHGGAGAVGPDDVVVAFSKGGRSAELTELVTLVRRRGTQVIAVTEAPDSPLASAADLVVALRTEPADADLDGLVATGSTLVAAAWGDGLAAVLKVLGGHTARDVVSIHPAGLVGHVGSQQPDGPGGGGSR